MIYRSVHEVSTEFVSNMKKYLVSCIAAAGAVFASGAIVSGSIDRECDNLSEAAETLSIRTASSDVCEVQLGETEYFDCREFASAVSNPQNILDCTLPEYLVILIK